MYSKTCSFLWQQTVFTLLSSIPQSGGTSDEFVVTTQEVVLGRKIEGLPSTDRRINRKLHLELELREDQMFTVLSLAFHRSGSSSKKSTSHLVSSQTPRCSESLNWQISGFNNGDHFCIAVNALTDRYQSAWCRQVEESESSQALKSSNLWCLSWLLTHLPLTN